ncbi:MAG: SulP family inorganic anion transporter, partial [Actinomycetota bacterium]
GPTAVTSLLTFGGLSAIAMPGAPHYIALAGLLAVMVGVIRVLLGLAKGGVLAYLMSQPVVLGFTAGAGVVILASQVPTVLGVGAESDNPFVAAAKALMKPGEWDPGAIVVAIVAAAAIIGGKRIHRLFPGVLAAVAIGIALSETASFGGPVVGDIAHGLPPLSFDLPWSSALRLLAPALVIAVIGFSEPASIARRYATLERQRWDPHRELISQGVANLAAGFGGGFPAGGSFTRSALVRDAGARTRLSGGITGLVVLLLMPVMGLLAHLPTAVLGATIMVAVRELVSPGPFIRYRRYARLQFSIAAVTFLLTIFLAPHVEWAVVAGVVMAILAHLWRELRISIPTWTSNGTLHLAPKGVLFFASAPGLEEAFTNLLSEHPEAHHLVVHLDGLGRVDLSGALVLASLLEDARGAGLVAEVVDVPPQAEKIIRRVIGS